MVSLSNDMLSNDMFDRETGHHKTDVTGMR